MSQNRTSNYECEGCGRPTYLSPKKLKKAQESGYFCRRCWPSYRSKPYGYTRGNIC